MLGDFLNTFFLWFLLELARLESEAYVVIGLWATTWLDHEICRKSYEILTKIFLWLYSLRHNDRKNILNQMAKGKQNLVNEKIFVIGLCAITYLFRVVLHTMKFHLDRCIGCKMFLRSLCTKPQRYDTIFLSEFKNFSE